MFTRLDPDDFDHVPRPVIAVANDYPPAHELNWHRHRRGQLLYAATGVLAISTPHGAWVAPPERAVWTPPGVLHSVKMVGAVSTRNVLVEAGVCPALSDQSRVIEVSPLLRSLLVQACEVEREYKAGSRDALVIDLLIAELNRAPVAPLSVPFPLNPALAAKCHAFLASPSPHDTIDNWSDALGLGRRAFTRTFRRETGMSFAEWRQQACVLIALPRLAAGDQVTMIALDLGYESPAAFTTMFKRLLGVASSRYQP